MPGSITSPPAYFSLPSEWWLIDTTAQQEARHQTYGLVNANWHAISGVSDSYFAIPASRLGRSLVVGSTATGWTQMNQGQVLGTYVINGANVVYQAGSWFEAWCAAPTPDYWVADLTMGERSSIQNVTDVSQVPWVSDSTIYPLRDVTFYLDAAERYYRYTLHWKIGTLEIVQAVVPTKVDPPISRPVLNEPSPQTIPAGAGRIRGPVAVGSEFWISRDYDGFAPPHITASQTPANPAIPGEWSYLSRTGVPSVIPPVDTSNWETVYFGIASARDWTAFTVNTSTFARETQLVETGLKIQDFYQSHAAHDFTYNLIKATLPHAVTVTGNKTFWMTEGTTPYGFGEQWAYGGWSWIGGTSGPLPPATPGTFNFSFTLQGSRVGHRIMITSPDSSVSGLLAASNSYPMGSSGRTLPDVWHTGQMWTTPTTTKTFSSFYSGPTGANDEWTLWDQDAGDLFRLYPRTVTNFTQDLAEWPLPLATLNLQISVSRHGHDLRVLQKDSLTTMAVRQHDPQGSIAQYYGQTYYTSYYYFEAEAYYRPDYVVGYWIYDYTTGEEAPYCQSMLVNWISTPEPAAPTVVELPNGALRVEWLRNMASPYGSFRVERRSGGSASWELAADIDAAQTCSYVDATPAYSTSVSYRIAYVFGPQISAYSPPTTFQWPDSDGDGLPDDWEIAHRLNAHSAADGRADLDNDGWNNALEFAFGGNPWVADATDEAAPANPSGRSNAGSSGPPHFALVEIGHAANIHPHGVNLAGQAVYGTLSGEASGNAGERLWFCGSSGVVPVPGLVYLGLSDDGTVLAGTGSSTFSPWEDTLWRWHPSLPTVEIDSRPTVNFPPFGQVRDGVALPLVRHPRGPGFPTGHYWSHEFAHPTNNVHPEKWGLDRKGRYYGPGSAAAEGSFGQLVPVDDNPDHDRPGTFSISNGVFFDSLPVFEEPTNPGNSRAVPVVPFIDEATIRSTLLAHGTPVPIFTGQTMRMNETFVANDRRDYLITWTVDTVINSDATGKSVAWTDGPVISLGANAGPATVVRVANLTLDYLTLNNKRHVLYDDRIVKIEEAGEVTLLPEFAGDRVYATAFNDDDTVVGFCSDPHYDAWVPMLCVNGEAYSINRLLPAGWYAYDIAPPAPNGILLVAVTHEGESEPRAALPLPVEVKKAWSDQLPDVVVNWMPNGTGWAEKPYIFMSVRADGKAYAKAEVSIGGPAEIRNKILWRLAKGNGAGGYTPMTGDSSYDAGGTIVTIIRTFPDDDPDQNYILGNR